MSADSIIKEKLYISLTEQPSAILSMEWYASKSAFPRRANNHITPLINGQAAFGAVYDAIAHAKKSIDIISWGFDAAMRFKRPGGERIGDLLKRKGKEGVEVRILIWHNKGASLFLENTVPGINDYSGTSVKDTGLSGYNRLSPPAKNDQSGYGKPYINSAGPSGDPSSARYTRDWHENARDGDFKNIEFRTRDFDWTDRESILFRQYLKGEDDNPWTQTALLALFPSHHQKMVLVDYDEPSKTVGFVMGHNMHRNYWDTSAHAYDDKEGLRDVGFGPWQDLSVKVSGQILFDLNTNFCKAWDRGSPWYKRWFDSALGDREHISPAKFAYAPQNMRSLAQICRTQPQEKGEQSIKELYMIAAGNARKYVYVENQYFRFPPWADKLKRTRKLLLAGGRDENLHGVCRLFVVTNVPDKSGRMNTYRMLQALGRSNQVPQVHREINNLKANAEVKPSDVAGLKILICTLMSDTKLPANNTYRPIYVHSKLLVVDDAFSTLGSANLNSRSMESDSELNIASDDPAVAREWREKLWALHTGKTANDDLAQEFKDWEGIIKKNAGYIAAGKPLEGHLVAFFDGGGKTRALD